MFDTLRGPIIRIEKEYITVETMGIGWKLFLPLSSFQRLGKAGETKLFYLSCIFREHMQALFGFLEEDERTLFEILCNTSGIGPKTALSIVGNLDIDHILMAVLRNDPKLLQKAPGIGKKTAERLIIELKEKVPAITKKRPLQESQSSYLDATQALINLGYSQKDAQKAVQKALENGNDPTDLSSFIAAALKK